jgi:hypothetical protein
MIETPEFPVAARVFALVFLESEDNQLAYK